MISLNESLFEEKNLICSVIGSVRRASVHTKRESRLIINQQSRRESPPSPSSSNFPATTITRARGAHATEPEFIRIINE